VELRDLPVSDPREAISHDLIDLIDLIDLLGGLSAAEWVAPTEAGHWRVKDVGLHLLDDVLGWLSRPRDGDASGLLSTDGGYRDFVGALMRRTSDGSRGRPGSAGRSPST